MKRLNELQHGITIRIWVTAASISSHNITSASVDCNPPWRPNSYLFQIQSHQIHSHYLCHYHFLKTFLVRQIYTPQNFLDFEPFFSRTAMTMHIPPPLGCPIHGKVLHE